MLTVEGGALGGRGGHRCGTASVRKAVHRLGQCGSRTLEPFFYFFFFFQALVSTGATLRPGGVAGLVTSWFFSIFASFLFFFFWLGSAC